MGELTYVYYRKGPGNRRAPKKRRTKCVRDYRYRAWIRTFPSIVSGYMGCEAAHTGDDGGMKMKASDTTCLPLTPAEHNEYHRIGKDSFERKYGVCCESLVERFNSLWFRFSGLVK